MLCDLPQDPSGLMETKAGNREARRGGPTGTAFVRAGLGETRGSDGHWYKQGSFKAQRNAAMRLKVSNHTGSQQLDIAQPVSSSGTSGSTHAHAKLPFCVEPTSTA